MINATLEKRPTPESRDGWWLELNGCIARENFLLAAAIESNAILNKIVEAQAKELVIDLTTIKTFDSEVMRLLLMLYKQLDQQNIHFVLRNPNPYLSRVLRIMQFDRVFDVEFDENYGSRAGGAATD